ncbi:MAG TPA: hypothetical protein VFK20_02375, partial [Vicinamibacterales bacterium]|nr:hypothetical protein [Vicinamibacterales bacterium]
MARASLRSRLTIVISGLILAAGLVFSAVAYMEVRRALERAGGDRLHAVATELSNLLTQSVTAGIRDTQELATKPDLRAALKATGNGPVAVPESMAAYVKRTKGSAAWLLRPDGSVVVAEPADAKLTHAPHASDEAVGPLVPVGDAIGFTLSAPLGGVGGEAPPEGYVVVRRISSGSGGGAIERLIGAGTNFKIGNADGSVWTDLSKPVDAPRAQIGRGTIRFVDAAGEARLGTAVAIAQTPWVVWLAMPRATVLQ